MNKQYEDENLDTLLQEFGYETKRKPYGCYRHMKTINMKYDVYPNDDYDHYYDQENIMPTIDDIEDLEMFNQ